MRIIKAPSTFPDAAKINASQIDADNQDAVLELSKEVIGRGYEGVIKSYLPTHEKRLEMFRNNGFTIGEEVAKPAPKLPKKKSFFSRLFGN